MPQPDPTPNPAAPPESAPTQAVAERPAAPPPAPALPDRPFDYATASLVELGAAAAMFAQAGMFKDCGSKAQAFAKIMVGKDLGIPITRALMEVTMIQGKPTLSANLMAAMIEASGRYRLVKVKHTAQESHIEVFQKVDGRWVSKGVSTFDMDDARAADLLKNPTWKKFPRNMLWSRNVSNIAKQDCGDVFLGSVYTPDELDDKLLLDGDGNVIETTAAPRKSTVTVQPPAPAQAPPPASQTPPKETHESLVRDVTDLAAAADFDLAVFCRESKIRSVNALDAGSLRNLRNTLRVKLEHA